MNSTAVRLAEYLERNLALTQSESTEIAVEILKYVEQALSPVWLNPWAWFEINDPKTLHVSEELFLKTHNLPKTLENCQKFKDALARVVKENTPKTKIVPMDDEAFPASN